jgi:hypothetical protein
MTLTEVLELTQDANVVRRLPSAGKERGHGRVVLAHLKRCPPCGSAVLKVVFAAFWYLAFINASRVPGEVPELIPPEWHTPCS